MVIKRQENNAKKGDSNGESITLKRKSRQEAHEDRALVKKLREDGEANLNELCVNKTS